MSAFLCNGYHLAYLVQAGIAYDLIEPGEADAVGECLLAANLRSLAARYGDPEEHEPYRHEDVGGTQPVVVLKAIRCLAYQSCEFPEWEGSDAKLYLDELEAAVLAALPERLRALGPAGWGHGSLVPAVYLSAEYDEAEGWELRRPAAEGVRG